MYWSCLFSFLLVQSLSFCLSWVSMSVAAAKLYFSGGGGGVSLFKRSRRRTCATRRPPHCRLWRLIFLIAWLSPSTKNDMFQYRRRPTCPLRTPPPSCSRACKCNYWHLNCIVPNCDEAESLKCCFWACEEKREWQPIRREYFSTLYTYECVERNWNPAVCTLS